MQKQGRRGSGWAREVCLMAVVGCLCGPVALAAEPDEAARTKTAIDPRTLRNRARTPLRTAIDRGA